MVLLVAVAGAGAVMLHTLVEPLNKVLHPALVPDMLEVQVLRAHLMEQAGVAALARLDTTETHHFQTVVEVVVWAYNH
jgi:hypothetical protein